MSMSSSFSCFAFFFSAIFLPQSLHYFVIIIYFYMFSWCLPISNIIISACSLVLPISNIILLPVLWKMIRAFQADRRTKVRHSVLKGSYYGPDGIRTRNTRLKRPMLLAYVFSIHYQVELRARRLGREFRKSLTYCNIFTCSLGHTKTFLTRKGFVSNPGHGLAAYYRQGHMLNHSVSSLSSCNIAKPSVL